MTTLNEWYDAADKEHIDLIAGPAGLKARYRDREASTEMPPLGVWVEIDSTFPADPSAGGTVSWRALTEEELRDRD